MPGYGRRSLALPWPGCLVWLIGNMGQGSLSPLRIVLAGAAIAALFSAFSQALLVVNQDGLDTVLFWMAGSSERAQPVDRRALVAVRCARVVGALLLAGQVNVLNAGEEIAGSGAASRPDPAADERAGDLSRGRGGVGRQHWFHRSSGTAMVRKGLSIDHRWLLPGCALLGAILLLLADTLSRVLILPQEVPVGVMTALFGAPFS